jgi:Flp pilus assembly protein TadG
MWRRWCRRTGPGERGTFALELAIVAPMLVGLLWLTVSAGRVTVASSKVQVAARDGARAASINHAGRAGAAARDAVGRSLRANGITCAGPPTVTVSDESPAPEQPVSVTVTCSVTLMPAGVSTRVTRTATSVLDTYRGTD